MPSETPRDTAALVALFQQAHSKIVSLRRLDDQIAGLVMQHERLQQEVREIQGRINEEFERVIQFNQAPAKIPDRFAGTLPVEAPHAAAAAVAFAEERPGAEPPADGRAAGSNGHAEPAPAAAPAQDDFIEPPPAQPPAEREPVRVASARRSVGSVTLTSPVLPVTEPARPAAGV